MTMRYPAKNKLERAIALAAALLLAPGIAAAQGTQGRPPAASAAPKQPKLTKLPKLVKFIEAPYPEEEKAAGRAASVTLEIAISETGAVTDAQVTVPVSPAFDAAALAAVQQFVFEPAEFDDKPAPVKITYRYDFVFKEEPKGPVVNFAGVVRNRFTKKPMGGAVVTLDGKSKATTGDDGHFEFTDVPLGKHTVEVAGPGVVPVSTEETIEEKKKLEVKYTVEPKEEQKADDEAADVEVVVVVPKLQKEAASTQIAASEGRRVPGTQGDTLKVVQNLPGVARAAAGSGALVVWGAAPQDTRVYVDGVRIPALYHGSGVRATVNSDVVQSLELVPGGYGPEYGRGIGGLVTIDTRAPRSDTVHGYVAVDIIDAATMVEGPIGDKTRFMAAFRKSYLDKSIGAVTKADVSDLFPIPQYGDAQVRIVRDLRENETLELFALGSSDRLTRVDDVDPSQIKTQNTGLDFGRVMIKYRYQMPDGGSVWLTPSIGRDQSTYTSNFGGPASTLDVQSNVYALRSGWRGRVAPSVVVTTGLDVEATASDLQRAGSLTDPPREGDIYVFGEPGPDKVNADAWQTFEMTIAPFGQLDWSLLDDRLHITPGLRVEPYVIAGNRSFPLVGGTPVVGFAHEDTAVDPRIAARFSPVKALTLKAAAGIYHQAPAPEDLSAVFGNPNLTLSTADHVLGGASYGITEALTVEAVGFYSVSSGLATRSELSTPALAQALVSEGTGRAFGGQILVREALTKGLFGWASYSLMRSERKDHPDSPVRLFDYDQTHVLTVVASYEPGLGFEVGTRFRYATGFPRTPVAGAFYDFRRDIYEPYFGAQNSIRIPAFVALDLRGAKRWDFGRVKVEVYLDVQNVTNQKNDEDIVYNYDYTKKSYITGFPILPVFGGRLDY